MRKGYVIPILITLAPSAAWSQAKDSQSIDCDGSTYEMVECLKAKTAASDKRLNKAYQDALKNAVSPQQAEKLRAAQRIWVQYRDANCQYYDAGEGTIARVEAGECMRSMTEARAKELESQR
jgi:uncharacterized protein YecT (DUF1311 family)